MLWARKLGNTPKVGVTVRANPVSFSARSAQDRGEQAKLPDDINRRHDQKAKRLQKIRSAGRRDEDVKGDHQERRKSVNTNARDRQAEGQQESEDAVSHG